MDSVALSTVVLMVLGVAVIVLAGIVIIRWQRANQQPIESLPALIVAKRAHVSGGGGMVVAHTTYYVTFELRSGERREFAVPENVYGQLAERDQGRLRLQGARFKGYDRTWQPRRMAG